MFSNVDINPVPGFSWQVGRRSWEAAIRPGAAVGWDTGWRQVPAMLYPDTIEIITFSLQINLLSPGRTPLWRVKQLKCTGQWLCLSQYCTDIRGLSIRVRGQRECGLSRRAQPPGGKSATFRLMHFFSFHYSCWVGQLSQSIQKKTNPGQCLTCVLQGHPHLLSYMCVRMQLKKIYILCTWKKHANNFKWKTWAGGFY